MNFNISLSNKFFYDERIAKRCNVILDKIIDNPGTGLSTLFESGADTVGVWRFLRNVNFNHVDIMKGYYDSTKKSISKLFRLLPENEIYVIQDTSEIDLSDNKAATELGYLSDIKSFWHLKNAKNNPDISKEESLANFKKFVKKGVYLHSSLACTVDGEPIGLTYQEQIIRDFNNPGTRRDTNKRIEDKESFKWIE